MHTRVYTNIIYRSNIYKNFGLSTAIPLAADAKACYMAFCYARTIFEPLIKDLQSAFSRGWYLIE